MTIEEMKKRKKECGYSYAQIAKYAGVPLSTVQKIFSGATDAPRHETLKALNHFFEETHLHQSEMVLRESSAYHVKKEQGDYTLEDYYSLPDDQRAELIDGVFYFFSAPTLIHQMIIGQVYLQLMDFIRSKQGDCIPFMAPVDVQLDCDEDTMLQPDVLVLCDRDKMIQRCIYGAPDFVVEVLSMSTKKKDCYKKLEKYQSAGVREYWMVDPISKRVIVYVFEEDICPKIYGFDDQIPVSIFEHELEIDMSEIYHYIQFMYEKEEKSDNI